MKKMARTLAQGIAAAAFVLTTAMPASAAPASLAERLITADSQVRELDIRLNASFRRSLQASPDRARLKAEQRAWLADVRDKCPDRACVVTAYTVRNRQLATASITAAPCPVNEKDLLANWQRAGQGDFEEFQLGREGGSRTFSSWLHHRPEMNGAWTFGHCILRISDPSNPELSFTFKIADYSNGTLHLLDIDSGASSRYKKLRD